MSVVNIIRRCLLNVNLNNQVELLNSTCHNSYKFDRCRRTLKQDLSKIFVQFRFKHQAAVIEKFGQPLVIKEVSSKKLNKSEVRIAIKNCGVNVSDLLHCQGLYESKLKPPFVPGFEVSGEVVEIGSDVKDIAVGDKIIALNKDTLGGFAEECIASINDVWKMPHNMDFESAAALADSYATVLIAARRANLQSDDTVLITAAAGGVGLAAVDIAANLYKAKVLGVCGTEDKAALVRDKGAFSAMSYKENRILDAVMDFTDGKGVKLAFDTFGGDLFNVCLKSIAMEGSIVVAGFASRQIPQIATSELLPKSCSIMGVSLTHYRTSANDVYRNSVQEVIDMFEEEFIEPHISEVFKLEQINEAFDNVQNRKSTGKVVIDI